MAATGIKVEGLQELLNGLQNVLPREAKNLARATVHGIAGAIRDEIRRAAPVETGELRKAIYAVRRRGTQTQIASDVIAMHGKGQRYDAYYWHFLEFGTTKMSAQPFVTPTVEKAGPKVPDIYRDQFGRKLERLMARKGAK